MSETIEAVAIKTGDMTYSLKRPKRHHDVIAMMARYGIEAPEATQGFLTSNHRFVDRKEALHIATTAGQITEKTGPADTLFSEDVW